MSLYAVQLQRSVLTFGRAVGERLTPHRTALPSRPFCPWTSDARALLALPESASVRPNRRFPAFLCGGGAGPCSSLPIPLRALRRTCLVTGTLSPQFLLELCRSVHREAPGAVMARQRLSASEPCPPFPPPSGKTYYRS